MASTGCDNVVLILTDQHRADAIGTVEPALVTPHLDRLAAEGLCEHWTLTPRGSVSLCCSRSSDARQLHQHQGTQQEFTSGPADRW
jgi:hypothetical protein